VDSEVVVGNKRGKGVLQRTSSGLTSVSGEPDFRLWAFDFPGIKAPYVERLEQGKEILTKLGDPRVRLLRHWWIEDQDELEHHLQESLALGYEGIITRSPNGPYKEGKSTLREQYMLKVKPFEDAEGRVIGYYEEMENTNEAKREVTGKLKRSSAKEGKVAKGRLGGLILQDVITGVEVRVGGGFTQRQRIELWKDRLILKGQLVKYKKQKMGEKDKPRHPNFVEFLHFRPEWDFAV
jgi:DNA ligase-1